MPAPSLTYTLSNGTTADASQVMQNFNDLLNGITDGTKDLSISALTLAGNLTANGNTTIGNSSSDTLTVTASLASNLVPSADGTYSLGSATIGYANLYMSGNSNQVTVKASASTSGDWTFTLPVSGGTNNYLLTTNGSGTSAWTAITNSAWYADGSNAGTLSATTQTIGGAKTFSAAATFSSGLVLGSGSTLSEYVAPTSVAYNASNFTTNQGTWTVGSGDQTTYMYCIIGKMMTIWIKLSATDVSGTPRPTQLRISIPASKTAAAAVAARPGFFGNNSTSINGTVNLQVAASGSVIYFEKDDGSEFAASTGGTYAWGNITFPIN